MPLFLLYVIAITLICFISIILTESAPANQAHQDHDSWNNQLSIGQQINHHPSRIDRIGATSDSQLLSGESTNKTMEETMEEEKAAEPYYYF